MKTFLAFAFPKFSLLALIFKKPTFLFALIPAVVVTKIVVDFESMAYIAFVFFIADLLTGIYGSYCSWTKNPEKKERWFFGKGEGFSSDKAKKMLVKGFVYLAVPLMLIQLQKVLFLKNFKYERISEAEFEWATIALIVICLIEGFSIFHENLPKCGFNLWHSIKKMIGFYKEAKKEINE